MFQYKRILTLLLAVSLFFGMIPALSAPANAATGYDRGYSGSFAGDGKIYAHGLDVSAWQGTTLDFNMIKNAGYDYVILRVGTGKTGKDSCFETYYANAKAAGLDVGCYYYSYATTAATSVTNANSVLSWIEGKTFEYPIYFDYEDSSQSGLSTATASSICLGFMDTMRDAGYLTGLYSMVSWLGQDWVTTSGIRSTYEGWVAHYPHSNSNTGINSTVYNTYNSRYCSSYGMYQYTSQAYIGSYGPYDANVCYKDYPTIVKTYGFNGYQATGSSATTSFGINISANLKNWIFNPTFYRNKYSDLSSMTDSQLYDHFLTYGLSEGRQGSILFNIKYYLNQNAELKEIYGSNYESAFAHFVEYGQREDRVFSKELTAVKDVIFDAEFYWEKYPSVAETMAGDVNRSFCHFLKIGLGKGYSASPAFSIKYYVNENDGLDTLYAEDYYGAMQHFLEYGQNELRGVSPVLDATYYTENCADAGTTTLSAMRHYLSTGMEQGLRANEKFLAEYYYFSHPDHLTGYTEETCYKHYLLSGYEDGLRAAPYAYYPDTFANLGAGFTAKMTNLKSGLNWSILGTSVIIYEPSESDAQKWHFVRQSDGSYEITNVKYGTVLTATDNGSADGMVTIAEDVDGVHQRWFLYEVGGYYSLRTACNKWIGVGLTGGSTASQTTVEMANFRDNTGHKYTINVLSVDSVECTEHSYLSSIITAPTCTTAGVTQYICTACGDSYTEDLAATGHNYDCVITEVTCTEDGITTYTCGNCGDSYTENPVTAIGHNWLNATCTEAKTCGNCGLTEGEALGHSYDAVVTDPTCTDEGYTTYTCASCGDLYATPGAAATGHSYADGICTACGAPVPTITPKYPTASLESEVFMNIYYTVDGMEDVGVEDMGLLTWTTAQDGTIDTAEEVIPGAVESGDYLAVRTNGISAKNLGDTIYFKIYGKLADGSYVYSKLLSTSPKAYAMNQIKNSTNAQQVSLCVALLNYGAAAQEYFGYNTDNLMNAELTEEQRAKVAEYTPYMVDGVDAVDSNKVGTFTNSGGFSSKYPSVSLEGAFAINYYFTPSNTPDTTPKLYYWDEATYNSVDTLLPTNATGYIVLEGDTVFTGTIEGIAAKNLADTIYVAAGYMSNGSACCTGVLPYSIGAFCVSKASSGSDAAQTIAAAMAVYGYYAKAYFASIQ